MWAKTSERRPLVTVWTSWSGEVAEGLWNGRGWHKMGADGIFCLMEGAPDYWWDPPKPEPPEAEPAAEGRCPVCGKRNWCDGESALDEYCVVSGPMRIKERYR